MKSKVVIRSAFVLALLILLSVGPFRFASASGENELTPPSANRLTPPAPVFDDARRLEELANRRKHVAEAIGPKSCLILFSTEPRIYTNDVDYQYRQENNLFYLTNLNQQRERLVLMPGNPALPEVLFIPRRSAAAETWTGHMYSPEEAAQLSGVKEIWDANEFEPFVSALRKHESYRPKPENIFLSASTGDRNANNALLDAASKNDAGVYLLMSFSGNGESREYRQEQRFTATWPKESGFTTQNATPIFAKMRLRKSPMELELLQHAIDISIEAHQRAEAFASQARWEYEVDAQVAYTFKLRNADNWGYPDIVGCGPNATTLHYEEIQGPVKTGQLLLMDVGAEYGHYSADVTRTFPVNGKFSKEQAEIYQIVYDAQEAVAKVSKPGGSLQDINRAATDVIREGLFKLGLITDRNSDTQVRIWFMHGTGHWLGMNVHDVGGGARFEQGMTFTNEPGIYIRMDALDNLPKTDENEKFIAAIKPAFEKYKGIGVRIEDDMQITSDGCKWMTGALPRSIADIEGFIAKARRGNASR
jgi:Xaa-Pro aminopeptidase